MNNDSFCPGWQATLDGREAPLWRADYLVRAVPFPPGRHVLEMRYAPWEVRGGWALTLCGAAALLALLFWEWRDGRSGKTGSA
ncbi:MAG: YfhO family protein [Geobacter sp.]|nr:MAG: YfhO family protein [Geobacter sp.]